MGKFLVEVTTSEGVSSEMGEGHIVAALTHDPGVLLTARVVAYPEQTKFEGAVSRVAAVVQRRTGEGWQGARAVATDIVAVLSGDVLFYPAPDTAAKLEADMSGTFSMTDASLALLIRHVDERLSDVLPAVVSGLAGSGDVVQGLAGSLASVVSSLEKMAQAQALQALNAASAAGIRSDGKIGASRAASDIRATLERKREPKAPIVTPGDRSPQWSDFPEIEPKDRQRFAGLPGYPEHR